MEFLRPEEAGGFRAKGKWNSFDQRKHGGFGPSKGSRDLLRPEEEREGLGFGVGERSGFSWDDLGLVSYRNVLQMSYSVLQVSYSQRNVLQMSYSVLQGLPLKPKL